MISRIDNPTTTRPPVAQLHRLAWIGASRELARLAVLAAILIIGQIVSPGFIGPENMVVIVLAVAGIGILSFGMTMVVITGEIDLSVAGTAVLASVIGGLLLPTGSPLVVIAATLLTGLAVGLVNGFIVAYLRISSLIATLAMMGIAGSLANILSRGQAAYPARMDGYMWFGRGDILGVPVPILLFLGMAAICVVLTRHSVFGRKLYATGGNARAAELSGIGVRRIKLAVFVICGLCAAMTGLIDSARLGYINPAAFPGLELRVLAVTVLGGAVLAGGSGSIFGAFIAALIIGAINNLLNRMGVSFYLQQVLTAMVILVVVLPGLRGRGIAK